MNTTQTERFGIEIETVGIDRAALARAIHSVVGGTITPGYDCCRVTMEDGRVWSVVRDGSLPYVSGEIVSPILTYVDLEALQNIVRAVRAAGARADQCCGIHIHVDGAKFNVRSVMNLLNIVHKQERILERAIGVDPIRAGRYCKPIDADFLARLDRARPSTLDELRVAWYGCDVSGSRYDSSRYHAINLNSLFYRGTIEFRYFNGTLHAGEVKSYVQFVLALAQKALKSSRSSRARRVLAQPTDEKWAFRVFLKGLGLVGDEFHTLRLHFTKRLTGSANRGPAAEGSA